MPVCTPVSRVEMEAETKKGLHRSIPGRHLSGSPSGHKQARLLSERRDRTGPVSRPGLDSQVSHNGMVHFVRKVCWSAVTAQRDGDVGVTPSIVDPRTKNKRAGGKKTLIRQRVSVQTQALLRSTRVSGRKQRRDRSRRTREWGGWWKSDMRHDTTFHDREGRRREGPGVLMRTNNFYVPCLWIQWHVACANLVLQASCFGLSTFPYRARLLSPTWCSQAQVRGYIGSCDRHGLH